MLTISQANSMQLICAKNVPKIVFSDQKDVLE